MVIEQIHRWISVTDDLQNCCGYHSNLDMEDKMLTGQYYRHTIYHHECVVSFGEIRYAN